MSLFHSSDINYFLNQIIPVGNWGAKLRETGICHQSWTREHILEEMRRTSYPEKPSRFNCTFACDNLNTMLCYHWKNNPNGLMYEVEMVDQAAEIHKGDFNAIEPLASVHFDAWQMADLYWRYDFKTSVQEWPGIECSEILIASPLKVIKIFDAYTVKLESEALGLSFPKDDI